jgi:hypothetical protein
MIWILRSPDVTLGSEAIAGFLVETLATAFLASYALLMATSPRYKTSTRIGFVVLGTVLLAVAVFALLWRVAAAFTINWLLLVPLLLVCSFVGVLLGLTRPRWGVGRDSNEQH